MFCRQAAETGSGKTGVRIISLLIKPYDIKAFLELLNKKDNWYYTYICVQTMEKWNNPFFDIHQFTKKKINTAKNFWKYESNVVIMF